MKLRNCLVPLLVALVGPSAFSADVTVTPYRPTISNPITISTPGQLELEAGGLHVKTGNARDDSLPYLLKLGLTKEWGLLIGGDAYLWSKDEQGQRMRGLGDTSFSLKRAFEINEAGAGYGFEVGAKLPTAAGTLGTQKTDVFITGIISNDIGKNHFDVNIGATRLGSPSEGTSRMQHPVSIAVSRALSPSWTGAAELSGVYHSGESTRSQFLVAASYSPTHDYAVDIGVAKGLTRQSQDWSVFTGLVIPVGKFW